MEKGLANGTGVCRSFPSRTEARGGPVRHPLALEHCSRGRCSYMDRVDVAIVGGGPAGSACAFFCARAGLRTVLVERETFPREKVCGDCLNPSCWPVLERLGVAEAVRRLPHG